MKDDVLRLREHSYRRTRDIIAATEARITVLKSELAGSEHHVVGLSNGKTTMEYPLSYEAPRRLCQPLPIVYECPIVWRFVGSTSQ